MIISVQIYIHIYMIHSYLRFIINQRVIIPLQPLPLSLVVMRLAVRLLVLGHFSSTVYCGSDIVIILLYSKAIPAAKETKKDANIKSDENRKAERQRDNEHI